MVLSTCLAKYYSSCAINYYGWIPTHHLKSWSNHVRFRATELDFFLSFFSSLLLKAHSVGY